MLQLEKLAESVRLCILRRKLHFAIRTLGFYDIDEFIHEVVVRTFIKSRSGAEDKYAYATIADKQISWTFYDLINKQKKTEVYYEQASATSNSTHLIDVKEQVGFILGLNILTQQEKQILTLRFVDGLTLRESSKTCLLSHEKVRMIEKVALNKVRTFYNSEKVFS